MKKLIGMAVAALFVGTAAFAQVPQQQPQTPQNNFPQTSPSPATAPQPNPAETQQRIQQNQSKTAPQHPANSPFPPVNDQSDQNMLPPRPEKGSFPENPVSPRDTTIVPENSDTTAPAETDTSNMDQQQPLPADTSGVPDPENR